MTRAVLPLRRHAETFETRWWGAIWRVTIGYFADYRTPGEVFISGSKSGADTEAVARDSAILLSLAIQHGVPLQTMQHALSRNRDGSPMTLIGMIVDEIVGEPPPPIEEPLLPMPMPPSAPGGAQAAMEAM